MILLKQILSDLKRQWLFLLLVVVAVSLMIWANSHWSDYILKCPWVSIAVLTLLLWLAIAVCRSLTNIYNLRKNEAGITWCQISILLAIGLWIIGFVLIFDIKSQPRFAAAIGIMGSVMTWIFQDTIKGVAAFIHLRLNNLLRIDDWIQVPSRNVDGVVKRATLTTVTIYNWDTTTSSIPTSVLHSEHFKNLKNMMDGKTYGRKMSKSFIMDTGWFHVMNQEDVEELKKKGDVLQYLPESSIQENVTNAQLFRLYLFYWLMNHPHVSQLPRLIVRWQDPNESGMPLEVYVFITDSSLPAYEWQQSQIIEHILEAMEWFGLRLYQSPSAYDVSNSNVFLTDKPATYRMEE